MDQPNHPDSKVLDLTVPALPVVYGQLNLGGRNPRGSTIELTNYYLLRDGKPVIPVIGEFHFSRYPSPFWEEELRKIRAGGVGIVATYVFWNHVEEDEGTFDWSGSRNLRRFVELCGRVGLEAIVRVGPFAHGEVRNGGLPDWLYGQPFALRSNDTRYLAHVRRLYQQIAAQLDGLLFKDGGPVIGIQLENEYMHAGAPWETTFRPGTEWVPRGFDGAAHMKLLKDLACEVGLDVPLYTCTGWLNSPVVEGEILPMQGGYAFTPWSPDPNYRQPPTREFLFRDRYLHPVLNGEPTYDPTRYPYVCCEIGGGIQDTYFHRNVVPPESVEALALMNLAGGANAIGYYMFHGGTNPVGKRGYMNEFTVPRRSYDFQAPLREFGQFAQSYRALRLIHTFLADFGGLLAPMVVALPDDAASITPNNVTSLRFAARHKDGAGFLFLNSYQDHVEMRDIPGVRFQLSLPGETLSFPQTEPLTLQKHVSAILPFGLSLDDLCLKYASCQLLAKLDAADSVDYAFFAPRGMRSEYAFDPATYASINVAGGEISEAGGLTLVTVTPGTDCVISLTNDDGRTIRILTLARAQAEQLVKLRLWGQERLVLSEANLVGSEAALHLYLTDETETSILIYPPPAAAPGLQEDGFDGVFARFRARVPEIDLRYAIEPVDATSVTVTVAPEGFNEVNEVYMRVHYVGDIGSLFIDGKLVADNFYNGTPWEIGLKRFLRADEPTELFVRITPLRSRGDAPRLIATGMTFRLDTEGEGMAAIHHVSIVTQYRIDVPIVP